jgi:hypothetical protein
MPKRIEFTCILFFENESFRPAKYRTVTNLASMFRYCDTFQKVKNMNIYHKATGEFMKQVHSVSESIDFYNSLPNKFE